jgi:hypothetical protein
VPQAAARPGDALAAPVPAAALPLTEAAAAVRPVVAEPDDPQTPPALTGKLSLDNGRIMFDSPIGQFEIASGGQGDSLHFFSASDVQAFAGRVVTVRGWPADGWVPGQPGATLLVEEWGPGSSGDIVSGRVLVSGEDVLINIRNDKQVKIDDPTLKAALMRYDDLGVVLPGPAEKTADGWHYASAPSDYYVLGGFSAMGAQNGEANGDTLIFTLQLAHGKTVSCEVPAASWDATPRSQRHYFFGHLEDGVFKAKGFTPSAGPWLAAGTPGSPNPAFRAAVAAAAGKQVDGDARFEL